MNSLHGKVAIITGASSGIGRATAHLFAQHGAAVILNARGSEALDKVASEIRQSGGRAAVVPGDVAQTETQAKMVQAALDHFGRLDMAINNAGMVGQIAPLAEFDTQTWSDVMSVNLTSAFLASREQIPAMLKTGGGALVFVSSFVGTSVGLPGMAAYGAAKAGLMGLVKGITADYGAKGIRANALLPGGTDTSMAGNQAQKDWAASLHALKRIAQPEEIAAAALFLAGSMGSFVAGSALYADGGNAAVK